VLAPSCRDDTCRACGGGLNRTGASHLRVESSRGADAGRQTPGSVSYHEYFVEVLDCRERVIEVVEQSTPLLVLSRAAKALGVVFKRFPLHQEQERTWPLDASRKFQSAEPSYRRDDLLRCIECFEEVSFRPGPHGQKGVFEYHLRTVAVSRDSGSAATAQFASARSPGTAYSGEFILWTCRRQSQVIARAQWWA
jgi:hypothetical protein